MNKKDASSPVGHKENLISEVIREKRSHKNKLNPVWYLLSD
jgi:hypothetical protein